MRECDCPQQVTRCIHFEGRVLMYAPPSPLPGHTGGQVAIRLAEVQPTQCCKFGRECPCKNVYYDNAEITRRSAISVGHGERVFDEIAETQWWERLP